MPPDRVKSDVEAFGFHIVAVRVRGGARGMLQKVTPSCVHLQGDTVLWQGLIYASFKGTVLV